MPLPPSSPHSDAAQSTAAEAPYSGARPQRFDLGTLDAAADALRQGAVLAYPTEAVYGLGADPDNRAAVEKIFALKGRPATVGVLLIAADFAQVTHLIDHDQLPAGALDPVMASWPGPTTWVFPRSSRVPAWVAGGHQGIALRVTAHAPTAALCRAFGGALVSTSANPHGEPPARSAETVIAYFAERLDAMLDAPLGEQTRSSAIRDVLTGAWLRV